ncbi:MAG: TonB-dependent receptor [Bacteroidales bacterium]
MKITTLLLIVGLVQVSAAVNSQSKTFSIKAENISIKDLIGLLEEKSQLKFVYRDIDVENTMVSINMSNSTANELLDNALTGTGKSFKMLENDLIVILPFEKQQQITVKGRITDASTGEGIPGVNVSVKGTEIGTITDFDGNYSLDIEDPNSTISISYMGYATQEIAVGGKTIIDVSLEPVDLSLTEVVVVGYGTTKRTDLTGSVGTVKGDEIQNQTVNSVADALQSRVSGVKVNSAGGAPGSSAQIFIRGFGNFKGIPPLWIIDGVQYSGGDPGSKISLKDIESIDILKDGSSSAIYGSQGAGGVIIVTTKTGKAGKLQINFNTGLSQTSNYNLPTLLDKQQYIETRNEYFPGGVWSNVNVDDYPTSDWMDIMTQKGSKQTYDFSVAGGNDKSTFYIGANYMKEKGSLVESSVERIGLRINSDHKLAKWATFGERIYLYSYNSKGVSTTPRNIYRTSPGSSVYDEDGTNPWYPGTWGYLDGSSPWLGYNAYAYTQISRPMGKNEALEGNAYLSIKPFKGLEWRTTGGLFVDKYFGSNSQTPYYLGAQSNSGSIDQAKYSENWGSSNKYTLNSVITYNIEFGKHDISVMAGFESIQGTNNGIDGAFDYYFNYSWPTMLNQGLENSANDWYKTGGSYNSDQDRLYSYFGRVKYDYSNKYLLTFNIRRDASSKFGPNNRVGIFPSASVAWKIHEEEFMKNVSIISMLKIRAEYGSVGNDRIESLYYLKFYEQSQNFDFENNLGAAGLQLQSKLPNEDIKWEAMITKGIALDWGILDNKLTGTFGYYNKASSDLLYNLPIQASAGLGADVITNIGKVKNTGFEIDLQWKSNIGDVNYSVGLNGATLNNEVVDFDGIDNAPIEGQAGTINEQGDQVFYKSEVGRPFASFYGYQVTHIMQEGETAPYATGPSNVAPSPGDLLYVDVNNDGAINNDDKQYIGSPWAKFSYGINASVEYKGFDLSVLFSGEAGQDVINSRTPIIGTIYNDYNTTPDIYNNSLFMGNGITDRPAHLQTDGSVDPNGNYRIFSSFWVEKGDYLKLRNLQIGYTLPDNLLGKYGVSKLRLYLAGQNLFTITKYSGIDPETTADTYNSKVISGGMADYNSYFPIRTFTFGVDLSF